jgi:hypothetical protein
MYEYAVQYSFEEAGTVKATGWGTKERAQAWLDRRESPSGVDSELGPYILEIVTRPKERSKALGAL